MHRVTGATLGAVAVGLVVVFLVVGFVLGGIPMAPLASSGHTAKGSTATAVAPVTSPAPAKVSTGAVTAARVYQTQIAIYINQIGIFSDFNGWYTSPVPTNFTFSTNITWGAISSADTHVWVNITDLYTSQFRSLTFPTNFSFDAANVVLYNNNGVLYSNYTWTVGLNASNLGCGTSTSCGKVLATDDYYEFAVTVLENGASMGGGMATNTAYSYANLVSTFTWGTIISPVPEPWGNAVPFSASFLLNTSWGWTTNATTNVSLWVYDFDTSISYNVTYLGTIGTTNTALNHGISVSSTVVFNGTVDGVWYSSAMFYVTLNQSFFACNTYSCNNTFGTYGHYVELYPLINESGASAGGAPTWTGLFYPTIEYLTIGSTLVNFQQFNYPSGPQGLPYVVYGSLNVTWVNPSTAAGNKTITGFIEVYNETVFTGIPYTYISLNDSVGTVNSDGFSLMPVSNGTVPIYNIPYTYYSWSLDLSAANLGANLPYADSYYAVMVLTVNGSQPNTGGVKVTNDFGIFYNTFAEYPTTVTIAVSPTLPGYVPLNHVQNFTIAVANAPITPTNTLIVVTIYDLTLSKEFGFPVIISTTALATADNQTFYQFEFNPLAMTCSNPACLFTTSLGFAPGPTDVYGFNITADVDGIGLPTNGTNAVSWFQTSFLLIFVPLVFYLVSPAPSAVITPGNLTVSVYFQGTFISGPPTLDIYSPTGALVLAESFATSGQNFTWVVTSAGIYKASVSVTLAYLINGHATQYSNTTLTVNKVPRIYVNSTAYSNATLVPGLSAAGAGTLLLILGLIIGMIVALLLGRAVWGGRQAPSPPQAWETKPAEGAGAGAAAGAGAGTAAAAGANSCSVCGKSFATPEELAAHGKSEHGME